VHFDDELRERTRETAQQTRALIASGRTPPPVYSAKLCDQCSLLTICNPQPLSIGGSVKEWLVQQIEE
jgi:CRISPR-associated exonuclease Cas4